MTHTPQQKVFLTKDDSRTILGAYTQLFRSQLDSCIISIYQNNSDSFLSRVNGLSSHSILNRFSIPDVSPLAAEGLPNINRKKIDYSHNISVTIEPMGSFFLAGQSAFYITLWIKLWFSSLGTKALYCLRNFHSPGFSMVFTHNVPLTVFHPWTSTFLYNTANIWAMCPDHSDPELFLHWLSFSILEANGSHSFLLKKHSSTLFFKITFLPQELKLIYREIQEMKLSITASACSLAKSSFLIIEEQRVLTDPLDFRLEIILTTSTN